MVTAHSATDAAMLLQIPDVLSAEQVAHARRLLASRGIDGRVTTSHQSSRVKDNQQLPRIIRRRASWAR